MQQCRIRCGAGTSPICPPSGEGVWLYLYPVIDVWSFKVVAWGFPQRSRITMHNRCRDGRRIHDLSQSLTFAYGAANNTGLGIDSRRTQDVSSDCCRCVAHPPAL
jgi:hypothetical protein